MQIDPAWSSLRPLEPSDQQFSSRDFSQGCAVMNADPGPATNSSPVGPACDIRLEAEVLPIWAAPGEMGRVS